MPNEQAPIEVFYSYAHEDAPLRDELEKHLSLLQRLGLISVFHHRQITAGTDRAQAIDAHLESASLILLLVSSDFLASDYCFGREMKRALERHAANEVRVIPILLRPVSWERAPFEHLQALPTDGKAITTWPNQDEAFTSVITSLRQMIETPGQLVSSAPSTSLPHIWNLPFLRNLFFTGRDTIIEFVHANYVENRAARSSGLAQAFGGLGGIGKTQLALEYAYRYSHEYDFILWTRATTYETLATDFQTLANLLQLTEKDEQNQQSVIEAVKRWLRTHTRWLLILDGIDDPRLAHQFIPSTRNGDILLTTRRQTLSGIAQQIEVHVMTPEEGALFLLRRANIIGPSAQLDAVSDDDRTQAIAISELLGGLPLALDQAGAYIEETATSLSDYMALYETQRAELLRERGDLGVDHPESVATTWSLSFEKLLTTNPATIELLRLLAFLDPESIPEEIITEGASELGVILEPIANNPFSLNAIIKELLRYSLLRRNPNTKTVSIHRLLQVILKDGMDEATQRLWAERAVRAVNRAFPEVEFAQWRRCQRCLPHAQACTILIGQWTFAFSEAARLLHHTGYYLYQSGEYTDAEPLLQQALTLQEQILGPHHPDIATSVDHLGSLFHTQGKYAQAEKLYLRALEMREQALGPNHPSVADSLSSVASLYRHDGKFVEAGQFQQRALSLREQILGADHPDVAESLEELALIYSSQGKYDLAEPLAERALAILEQTLGTQHPNVAMSLSNLALLYYKQKKYIQAEPLYLRALTIQEQILGPQHIDVASSLNSLAGLYIYQEKYDQAISLLERSLAIYEKMLGDAHPRLAHSLNNLASLYIAQENYAQARPLLERSLTIREEALGPEHPDLIVVLRNLAGLYREQQQYAQAEGLYQRILSIHEAAFGSHHSFVMQSLGSLAKLYRDQDEYIKAAQFYQRALAIGEEELKAHHPDAISLLESYAVFLQRVGRAEEAEQVLHRVQESRNMLNN